MREVPIAAERREGVGKGFARRIRMDGRVPGVMYGPETEPISLSIGEKDLRLAFKQSTGAGTIYNLSVDGKETKVVLREIQRDPVTTHIIHLDFHAISMSKPLRVAVPVKFHGVPVGVKVDGGIMQITMREIEVSCLPQDIPGSFDIDVSELAIGDSIHVRNLKLEAGTIISPEQRTIVVIAAPTVVKETAAAAAEGEEAEKAEGAEGEGEEGEEGEEKE
ncbi:MAG TPA: 50S ribosomal protein L25 [candidate division Zixibacteria bacterium]|nr:50S ribosomal protein L25 [candidate division Zixibacteria bacterium]